VTLSKWRPPIGSIRSVNKSSLIFFVGSVISYGTNFLFQSLMSRLLGPSTYGALGSLLGLITVVTLVASALQAAITHAVASGDHTSNDPIVGLALRKPFLRLSLGSFVLIGSVIAASKLIENYLHLSSELPVIYFALFLGINVLCIIPQGVLLGDLSFTVVAVGLVANALVRLVLGVVLVHFHEGLNGAMVAAVAGAAIQLMILIEPIRKQLLAAGNRASRLVNLRYATLAAVSLGGVSSLIGLDSVLARHYLERAESGYYVAAATGARIALFLSGAITSMAFPAISRAVGDQVRISRLLRNSAITVFGLGFAASLGVVSFPHLVISVLFGSRFQHAATVIQILSISSAEMGLISLLTYYSLAHRSMAAFFIALMHKDPIEIAWIMVVTTSALLIVQAISIRMLNR